MADFQVRPCWVFKSQLFSHGYFLICKAENQQSVKKRALLCLPLPLSTPSLTRTWHSFCQGDSLGFKRSRQPRLIFFPVPAPNIFPRKEKKMSFPLFKFCHVSILEDTGLFFPLLVVLYYAVLGRNPLSVVFVQLCII